MSVDAGRIDVHRAVTTRFGAINDGRAADTATPRRPVAERSERQVQLDQIIKMEAIKRVAGGMAHHFGNQLSVILLYTSFALDKAHGSDSISSDLLEIQRAAAHSADIVRQLAGFAVQQRRQPPALDLNIHLSNMVPMLHHLFGGDIVLTWDPEPRLWPVAINPSDIDQIVTNLCINARDAITGTGSVSIETRNCRIGAASSSAHPPIVPGDYVRLTIDDSGVGIDPAIAASIFEPFFTTKDVGAGIGLGLSTVHGAVSRNSGFITGSSMPGNGARFEINLPRYSPVPVIVSPTAGDPAVEPA